MELSSLCFSVCLLIELLCEFIPLTDAEGPSSANVKKLHPAISFDPFHETSDDTSIPSYRSHASEIYPFESNINPFLSHISQAWRVKNINIQSSISGSESKEDEPFGDGEKDFRLMVEELFRKKPQDESL